MPAVDDREDERIERANDAIRQMQDSDAGHYKGIDLRAFNAAMRDVEAIQAAEANRRELEGLRLAKVGAYSGVIGVVIAVVALVVAVLAYLATLPPPG